MHRVIGCPPPKTTGYQRLSPKWWSRPFVWVFTQNLIQDERGSYDWYLRGKIFVFSWICTREHSKEIPHTANSKLFRIIFLLHCKIFEEYQTQQPLFCAKIYFYISLWTLSVLLSLQFSLSLALGFNFLHLGADNVRRQISVRMFASDSNFCLISNECLTWYTMCLHCK